MEIPFETDTKGRLFVVEVSINWATNRNGQTKVFDTWKVTKPKFVRQKRVNSFLRKQIQLSYLPYKLSSTLVCQLLLVGQFIETSTTKRVFLWYRSQRDVNLFCKIRMTFT